MPEKRKHKKKSTSKKRLPRKIEKSKTKFNPRLRGPVSKVLDLGPCIQGLGYRALRQATSSAVNLVRFLKLS